MKNTMKLLSVSIIGIVTLPVLADMFTPTHYCSAPYKPYEFSSQYELEQFNRDVESYQNCISDFVEEQNRAAESHREEANDAIEEWNRYVRNELN